MSGNKSVVNNSPFSKDELAGFEQKLLEQKKETEKEIKILKERLEDLRGNAEESQSSVDHHQGDLGTREANKTRILSSIERNNERLDKIIVALDRVGAGNYGICIESGQPIQKERLEAIPYAIRAVGMK
jgi:DnaK suppressor protein